MCVRISHALSAVNCLLASCAMRDTICYMTVGEWLREARADSGLALMEIAFRLRDELPRALWVSTDTIRRIETKSDPDPVLVAALARVYGIAPDDWPTELRDEIEKVARVLDPAVRRLLLESAGQSVAEPVGALATAAA